MQAKRTKLGHQLGVLFCLCRIRPRVGGVERRSQLRRQHPAVPVPDLGRDRRAGPHPHRCRPVDVQSQRAERVQLEENLAGLSRVLETLVEVVARTAGAPGAAGVVHAEGNGLVLAGTTAYHRPACRLAQDHPRLVTTTAEMATESGLAPCRTCEPEVPVGHLHG